MIKKIVSIVLLLSVSLGFAKCKDDNEGTTMSLTLSNTDVKLKTDESFSVSVLNSNGRFKIDIDDTSVVKAVISENIIRITAVSKGSTTIKVTDDGNQTSTISVTVKHNVDISGMISFDVAMVDKEKQGNIGFLHSVNLTAPADSFITLIKPKLWRVGRYNDAFKLYHRLKKLGVERQLLALSDLRTEVPYRSIFQEQGYGVMTEAIVDDIIELGLEYEFDLYNEPNRMTGFELNSFMDSLWIPAYRAVKKKLPNALIHGPATSINSTGNPKADSLVLFQFIDKAIESNTLPDYINWHLQIGYNVADWHIMYADNIVKYINSKGHSIRGCVVGETIRPGNERNTSPSKLIDMFLSAEAGNIPQIRAAWSSSKIYGVSTSIPPVLCGILTGTDGKGRRGAWWTYRFFAETEGVRIECKEGLTGSENVIGIAYKDESKGVLRSLVGLRDTKKKQNTVITFNNLNYAPYISQNGKTHIKMWYNYQTEVSVSKYGSAELPLIMDKTVEIVDGKIEIPVTLDEWDAVLIEIAKP